MFAIEMIGAVYCPLSPRDPEQRLQRLIDECHARIVLFHHSTRSMFHWNVVCVDIDSVCIKVADQLFNVLITANNISYIVFTSGSTGVPKMVCP